MPSNKDLISEAEALAEELGLEISTEGLNNQALAALVSDLKAKKKDQDNDTPADEAAAAEAAAAEAQAAGPVIAPGKCLTSLKGLLSEGMPVTPEHFPGGQETFNNLKERGFIE